MRFLLVISQHGGIVPPEIAAEIEKFNSIHPPGLSEYLPQPEGADESQIATGKISPKKSDESSSSLPLANDRNLSSDTATLSDLLAQASAEADNETVIINDSDDLDFIVTTSEASSFQTEKNNTDSISDIIDSDVVSLDSDIDSVMSDISDQEETSTPNVNMPSLNDFSIDDISSMLGGMSSNSNEEEEEATTIMSDGDEDYEEPDDETLASEEAALLAQLKNAS